MDVPTLKMKITAKVQVISEAAAIALITALTYVIFLPRFYNFDGVACAMAVEIGKANQLFHGNHLVYGFTGFLFDRALRLVGYGGLTITSLQLLNVILASAAIGLFYILLRRISGERFCSLIFSLFAAVSFGYWFWAGEAQVYPLSYVPLVAIFYLGVTRKVSAHPYAVALLHMWAVAGHVLHVIFAAVILYFIASESAGDKKLFARNFAKYAALLLGGMIVAYGVVAALAIRPADMRAFLHWLSGSATLHPGKAFQWHGAFGLAGIIEIFRTQYSLLVPFDYKYIGDYLTTAGYRALLMYAANTTLVVLGAILLVRLRHGWRQHRTVVISSAVWLGVYFLFLSTWEPATLVYSLANVFPIWSIMFVVFYPAITGYGAKVAIVAALAVLTAANLICAVSPLSDPLKNARLQRMLQLRSATPPGSVIVLSNSYDKVYVPYFAGRIPFYMSWFDEDAPAATLRLQGALRRYENVFAIADAARELKTRPDTGMAPVFTTTPIPWLFGIKNPGRDVPK